jgi:hypothetical protein
MKKRGKVVRDASLRIECTRWPKKNAGRHLPGLVEGYRSGGER